MSKLPAPERWFVWKVPCLLDDEKTVRLFTPWADPMEYEYPFDFLYETEKDALEGLEIHECQEEAKNDGWILCEETINPLRRAP